MPRNSSGNYVLPTGNPVQPNTLIESAWANLTMEDIAAALTESLDRNGRGGMLAPFLLADGTGNTPGMGFANEPSMGIFRAGSRDMRATILGVPRMRWTIAGTENWDGAAWRAFGTAAYAALTTSPTDTTAGRVLQSGAFGLGAEVTPLNSTDCNELVRAGWYVIGPLAANRPPAVTHGGNSSMLVVPGGIATRSSQMFFSESQAGIPVFIRNRLAAGAWGDWRRIMYREDNLAGLANLPTARTNLGLGTAAVANVTTSQADETTGRLLKLGDWGLGNSVGPFLANFHVAAPRIGFWSWSGTSLNAPGATGGGALCLPRGSSQRVWMASEPSGGVGSNEPVLHLMSTSANEGDFSPWRRVYHTGNLLGAVSQTGGVPTGAAMQSGSNANGNWTRFADGTQICRVSTVSSASADSTWTFPVAFAANPNVVISPATSSDAHTAAVRAAGLSTISVAFATWNNAGVRASIGVQLMAIGRWF